MTSSEMPTVAMVLAAGLGKRMRPITDSIPKPLVRVAGRTLLDRGLDVLADAGVVSAVVNVHHFPDQIVAHLDGRTDLSIGISDESAGLLDSAGAIAKALPQLGAAPFFILNADTFWIDGASGSNLRRLALAWDRERMDILLMLADISQATGHSGGTDFVRDPEGRLTRAAGAAGGLIYAGAAIASPDIFASAQPGPDSLNRYFDRAIESGRLFGFEMDGHWITVGTPDAIPLAEAAVSSAARRQ